MDFEKAVSFNAAAICVLILDVLDLDGEEVLRKRDRAAFFCKCFRRMQSDSVQRAARQPKFSIWKPCGMACFSLRLGRVVRFAGLDL